MSSPYIVTIIQNSNPAIVVEAPIPDSFWFDVGATYEQMLPQGFTNNKVVNTAAALTGTRLAVQALTAQLWAGNTDSELSMELEFHTETDPVQDVRTPIVNLLKLTMPTIDTKSGFLGSPGPQIDFSKAGTVFSDAVNSVASDAGGLLGGLASGMASTVSAAAKEVGSYLGFGTAPKPASLQDSNAQPSDGNNDAISKSLQQNPNLGTAKYWNTMIKNKISISIGNYLYFDSVVITRVSQTFASNFDAQTGLPHNVRVAVAFKPLFMLAQEDLDTLFVNPGANSTSGTNSYGFSIPNQGSVAGGGSVMGIPVPTPNVGNNSFNFTL
jgi:hypothetical protein